MEFISLFLTSSVLRRFTAKSCYAGVVNHQNDNLPKSGGSNIARFGGIDCTTLCCPHLWGQWVSLNLDPVNPDTFDRVEAAPQEKGAGRSKSGPSNQRNFTPVKNGGLPKIGDS